jgi:Zn-dependent peptidase ImmA (M78 family)
MLIASQKFATAFKKVLQIKEHKDLYCLDPSRIPVSIEDLVHVVSDMYGLKISINEVVFEGDRVRGLVERYNNQRALIYIRHNMTPELKRFSVTKELMHLAIDEHEDWSVNGVATISDFLVEMSIVDGNAVAKNGSQSEMLAEIAAIEVLYPAEFRVSDKSDLASGKTTLIKLSLHYEIPVFVVDKALQPWYVALSEKVWANVVRAG